MIRVASTGGVPVTQPNSFQQAASPPPIVDGNYQLGGYSISPQPPTSIYQGGYYFALQVQVMLFGDFDPADWAISQTAEGSSGSVSLRYPRLRYLVPYSYNDPAGPVGADTPLSAFTYETTGAILWVDTPGIPNPLNGGTVAAFSVTQYFEAIVTHGITGANCGIDWNVTFSWNGVGPITYNLQVTNQWTNTPVIY